MLLSEILEKTIPPGDHGEVIHHINGDRNDNSEENLIHVSRSTHRRIHEEMKRNGIESKNRKITMSIYQNDQDRLKPYFVPGESWADAMRRALDELDREAK